ncbi:DUF3558 family protein [Crossiella cryophila]|uniref:DUF3558 domain-containing protein n=1 Tax=Crossiella cryophila TaxID=43355 RepID=A0A7W7FR97_9PSEU|nr:DUF3558 family protein [Crossiella cryophila]MBB4674705.1 hypothetical protein [Crossiella cryophila]
MTQSKIAIGGVLLAALVLGGCSGGPVVGTPTPATSSGTSTSGSTGDGPGASLAAVKPCELLTNPEAASLGLNAGRPEDFGKKRQCQFRDVSVPQPVTGNVTIDPVFGFDQLRTPPDTDETGIRKLTVDGRRVNYYPANGGTLCTVNIEVNKTEVVFVQTTLRQANTPGPVCSITEKMVGFVLPRMPKK